MDQTTNSEEVTKLKEVLAKYEAELEKVTTKTVCNAEEIKVCNSKIKRLESQVEG